MTSSGAYATRMCRFDKHRAARTFSWPRLAPTSIEIKGDNHRLSALRARPRRFASRVTQEPRARAAGAVLRHLTNGRPHRECEVRTGARRSRSTYGMSSRVRPLREPMGNRAAAPSGKSEGAGAGSSPGMYKVVESEHQIPCRSIVVWSTTRHSCPSMPTPLASSPATIRASTSASSGSGQALSIRCRSHRVHGRARTFWDGPLYHRCR